MVLILNFARIDAITSTNESLETGGICNLLLNPILLFQVYRLAISFGVPCKHLITDYFPGWGISVILDLTFFPGIREFDSNFFENVKSHPESRCYHRS